jgi:hypothetical protein
MGNNSIFFKQYLFLLTKMKKVIEQIPFSCV